MIYFEKNARLYQYICINDFYAADSESNNMISLSSGDILLSDYYSGKIKYDFESFYEMGDEISKMKSNVKMKNYFYSFFNDVMVRDVNLDNIILREPIKLAKQPWYFGDMTYEIAKEFLKGSDIGTYLVRRSQSDPNKYSLQVNVGDVVMNSCYRIDRTPDGFCINGVYFFKSINQLLEFYTWRNRGTSVDLKKIPERNKISKSLFMEPIIRGNWILNEDSIKLGSTLDEGAFGVVKKAKYKNMEVAVKSLKNEEKHIDSFLTEAAYMTIISHPNIISVIGIFVKNAELYVALEFCNNGSLINYLQNQGRSNIKKSQLKKFTFQIAQALDYLSGLKLIHRDVAARNVLLTNKFDAKLADFGLVTTRYRYNTNVDLPLRWTAPEIVEHKLYSEFSDVWSFGILLWEIFTYGRNPYPKWNNEEIMSKLANGLRMEAPDKCPKQIKELMFKCWNFIPNKRPTFKEINIILENINIYG